MRINLRIRVYNMKKNDDNMGEQPNYCLCFHLTFL